MALPRVFVIDDSEAVRETLSIVLGSVYEVRQLSPSDCTATFPVRDAAPDLLIVNADTAPATLLRGIAHSDQLVIWLRADPTQGPPVTQAPYAPVVLPRQFDAHTLRNRVQQLLQQRPAATTQRAADKLLHPYLPHEAALVAREAVGSQLPVVICGEPGTGRARIAAALHASGPPSRFVAIAPQNCTRATVQELVQGGQHVTVFVDDVAAATAEAQSLLIELAETSRLTTQHGWLVEIRLITATASTLSELATDNRLSRDLFYRLSVLPISLTPLRERPEDVPDLARAIAADLCSMLGCPPVAFTPRAMQRLSHYLWFGNTVELETVLARTISLVHKEVLDADDLLFGYGRLAPTKVTASHRPTPATSPLATTTVDLIINELAHEFKNPLVTIKAFAQHLDRLLDEESGNEQLVRLTGEAVDRMDRALENLLQFTRFEDPAIRRVTLGEILGPVLAEIGPLLSERQLVLDYRPTQAGMVVAVDPEQVSYALDNLLRTLIRSMRIGNSLTVACAPGGVVTIGLPPGGDDLVTKLRTLLSPGDADDETALPLGAALARSLIIRNGGEFDLHENTAGSTVTIRLPGAEEMRRGTREHGTTTDSNR